MPRRPIDPAPWIPVGVAALVAALLVVIGLSAKAGVFFYQMAVCSLVVAVSLGVLARRSWGGRSYWDHAARPRRLR